MNPRKRPAGEGRYLLEYEEVASTQDEARTLYKCGETAIIGIIARYQHAGRGRHGRMWVAPAGTCLLVTYIVPIDDLGTAPRIGMAGALAVAETIEEQAGLEPRLKWPNDVLINGRKVAGILVETVNRSNGESAALVGIGVNLNVESFPLELEQTATSLRIEGRRVTDVFAYESALRDRLFGYCSDVSGRYEEIRRRWLGRDVTVGRRYRMDSVEGTAESIAESGALMLRLDDGRVVETVNATAAGPP